MNDDLDPTEEDEAEDDEAKIARPRRSRTVKKKAKKKTTVAAPSVKVDPAQALAFIKQRIREEKDPLTKAFYERELAPLQARVKKAEEDRRAGRFVTSEDGVKVKIGERAYVFEDGVESYRNGNPGFDPPALHECVVKDVLEPEYQGGKKRPIVQIAGKGQKTLSTYSRGMLLYADPRSAVDRAIKGVEEEIEDKEQDLATSNRHRDMLLELRKVAWTLHDRANGIGREAAPTPTPSNDRTGRRWTAEEDELLMTLVATAASPEDIATSLGRGRDRVVRRMHQLGIKAPSTPFHDFAGERAARSGDGDKEEAQPSLLERDAEAVPA